MPDIVMRKISKINKYLQEQYISGPTVLTGPVTFKLASGLGLGSIAKTSSAQLSIMIDTHHLLTSSNELDTLYHYLTF